jgi:hypothetical protein
MLIRHEKVSEVFKTIMKLNAVGGWRYANGKRGMRNHLHSSGGAFQTVCNDSMQVDQSVK